MAGVSITIEQNISETVAQKLHELMQAGVDMSGPFTDIGEGMLNSTRQRFEEQVDPQGEDWEPLNPKYQARKKKNADKVLVLEGFMRDTLAYNADDQGIELGTNRIQGASMQFGDDERGIPERPFLGMGEDDDDMIVDILQDHLEQAFM
jgi:phage virion morphogenesis protein